MCRDAGGCNITPSMRYRDAPAAIEWLCYVFGFTKNLVVPGPDDTVAHAQLTLGTGMIMLGSLRNDEYGRMIKTPQEVGANTQRAYVVVSEVDAHYQRAKTAGAEIVMETVDQHYGGRLYSALDLEGHLVNFGSHDRWA